MTVQRIVLSGWPPAAADGSRRLFQPQRAMLACDDGIDIGIAGVGGGKTVVGALKLLRWALRFPRARDGKPALYFVVGRDYRLVREVQLAEIDALLRCCSIPYRALVRRTVAGDEPRIELVNGAVIMGYSGTHPDRMRGPAAMAAWLDEAEWQPLEAFVIALQRMRSSLPVRMVVTSSPRMSNHAWLWQLISGEFPTWDAMRRDIAIRVHRWSSADNRSNDPGTLAVIRSATEASRPGMARQELDGLFVGTSEAPMPGIFEGAEKAFPAEIELSAQDAAAACVGIDLGRSQDWTVAVVLSRSGCVLGIDRFNASSAPSNVSRDDFYLYAEERLSQFVRAWRVPLVKMDTAMHGEAFAASFRRNMGQSRVVVDPGDGTGPDAAAPNPQLSRVVVDGYRTDSVRRKSEAVEALGHAIGRGNVVMPLRWRVLGAGKGGEPGPWRGVANIDAVKREMRELSTEDRPGGWRAFTHPTGGHDDLIVGLALAWQGLSLVKPSAARGPVSAVTAPGDALGWWKTRRDVEGNSGPRYRQDNRGQDARGGSSGSGWWNVPRR